MIAWWGRQSIRTRLVTLYTVALLVILVPSSAVSFVYMRSQLLSSLDEELAGEADEAVLVMTAAARAAGNGHSVLQAALRGLEAVENVHYQLWSEAAGTVYLEGLPNPVRRVLPPMGQPRLVSAEIDGERRVRVLDQLITLDGESFWFRVVAREDAVRSTLSRLLGIHIVGLIGAVVFAGLGGYFLARRALAPVRHVTERARLLTADRLKDGIPVANPHDELGRLARTFNDVFSRLDASFGRLRDFAADASHELRTPLTAIRSVAELGLDRDDAGKRECLESILEEVQQLTKILDSLLLLARAESEEPPLVPVPLDLAELSREIVHHLAIVAEERSQVLRVEADGPVMVRADRQHVRHALMNVVDNAIKHGGEHCAISLTVENAGTAGVVTVHDNGPGIPAADLEHVFERFYRVDKERSRAWGGSGLGLAIASWAVKANGGSIEVESTVGKGTTFRIVLPFSLKSG